MCTSKLPVSITCQMMFSPEGLSAKAMSMGNPMDLSDIPKDYHEFTDVFDKKKADTLPPHCYRLNLGAVSHKNLFTSRISWIPKSD